MSSKQEAMVAAWYQVGNDSRLFLAIVDIVTRGSLHINATALECQRAYAE